MAVRSGGPDVAASAGWGRQRAHAAFGHRPRPHQASASGRQGQPGRAPPPPPRAQAAADPSAQYDVREQIGKGASGSVFLVVHKESRKQYVLKRIRLAKQTNWQRSSTLQEREMVRAAALRRGGASQDAVAPPPLRARPWSPRRSSLGRRAQRRAASL
jgi:hypothetical protein